MATDSSLIINGVDIVGLSDDELYDQLVQHDVPAGPITATTRKAYERKLAVKMGGDIANYSLHAEDVIEDDEAEDVEPTQAYIDMLAAGSARLRRKAPEESVETQECYTTEAGTEDYTEAGTEDDYSAAEGNSPRAAYLRTEQQQEQSNGGGMVLLVLLVLGAIVLGCALMFGGEQDAFDSLDHLAKEALKEDL